MTKSSIPSAWTTFLKLSFASRSDTITVSHLTGNRYPSKVFTIITSEKYLTDLKSIFQKSIIRITENLAMITMKSPIDLENTPGVNAFVYSRFRENAINIVEQMSCWTDTIIVISDEDIPKVINFLSFK